MARKEAAFTKEFTDMLTGQFPDGWVYKIPDAGTVGPARPFDVIAVLQDTPFAFELKFHNSHCAFPFSKVEDHQIQALEAFSSAGGLAWVVIGVRFDLRTIPEKAAIALTQALPAWFEGSKFDAIVFFTVEQWKKMEEVVVNAGRNSVGLLDLIDLWACFVIDKGRIVGDLDSLFTVWGVYDGEES